MKKVLFVNCCIRKEDSRSLKLAKHFIDSLDNDVYQVEELCLMDEPLEFFKDSFFEQRERLLKDKKFDHPRFRYASLAGFSASVPAQAVFWLLSGSALSESGSVCSPLRFRSGTTVRAD